MMQSEKLVWREILELFRDLPCLWKTNHDHYRNKVLRSQAMSLLFGKYKAFDKHATLAVFKKKLENMRTSYGRERKKIISSTKNGTCAEEIYVPTLWYFELLTFLDENDTFSRNDVETINFTDVDNSLTLDPSPPSPPPPVVKKRSKMANFHIKRRRLLGSGNTILNPKETDWEIIGKSFGVQLKDLCENQQPIAKKLISDVIFYGSIGKLTNDSFISNPTSPFIASPLQSPHSVPSPSPISETVPFIPPQCVYKKDILSHPSSTSRQSHQTNCSKQMESHLNQDQLSSPVTSSNTSIDSHTLTSAAPLSMNTQQITNIQYDTINHNNQHYAGESAVVKSGDISQLLILGR